MDRWESEGLTETVYTIENIAEFLHSKIAIWTFSKLLATVYHGKEPLRERLEKKLSEYEPRMKPEAVGRKVRNWLSGRNMPSDRDELFKVCFALGLDEKSAGSVLGTTAESGIHLRNPKELIYAYCLRTGLDYPQAVRLAETLWSGPLPAGTLEFQSVVKSTGATEDRNKLTASIRDKFKRVRTQEELRRFFEEYRSCFGYHHNTAYRKFTKMLDTLLSPREVSAELPADKAYSLEKVADEYLRFGMPYEKRSAGQTALQKKLKEHWPTPRRVREMYARRLDVDRKTLLLLYVATEGMTADWLGTPEDWLREHFKRLGLLLSECGLAALDPHSPFDFLILQAIHKEKEGDFMGYRLERMVRRLYPKNGTAAYVAAK